MDLLSSVAGNVLERIEQKRGTDLEKKVKEATSGTENWGANTTLKDELARATYDFHGYSEVMNTLWLRLAESSKNWKIVFKSLELLDYLLRNGSERVVSESRDKQYQIRSLREFQAIDAARGRDAGSGVRDKSRLVLELLNNEGLLKDEREKAENLRSKIGGRKLGGASSINNYSSRYDRSPRGVDSRQAEYSHKSPHRVEDTPTESSLSESNFTATVPHRKPKVTKKKIKKKSKKKVAPKSPEISDFDVEEFQAFEATPVSTKTKPDVTVSNDVFPDFMTASSIPEPIVDQHDLFIGFESNPQQSVPVMAHSNVMNDLFGKSDVNSLVSGTSANLSGDVDLFSGGMPTPTAPQIKPVGGRTTLNGKFIPDPVAPVSFQEVKNNGDPWDSGLVNLSSLSLKADNSKPVLASTSQSTYLGNGPQVSTQEQGMSIPQHPHVTSHANPFDQWL